MQIATKLFFLFEHQLFEICTIYFGTSSLRTLSEAGRVSIREGEYRAKKLVFIEMMRNNASQRVYYGNEC